ncbi:phage structural protein [Cupriavidus sp. D384]|uniref:phage structural protein n=1 Tax=Cupriavidus sp. D384 TaxID=1538095 RepID=UPI00082A048E|nr:phage protein [Cupriavidus sp. D384]
MTTHTYDPARINVTVGAATLSGFAEDSFIGIEELGDGVTSKAGADGEVARAMSSDRRCRVTIKLLQTSRSNDLLSSLLQADRLSGGNGLFPVAVADLRGRSVLHASEAWVVKLPTSEFGKEVGEREWIIETGGGTYFVGGNT